MTDFKSEVTRNASAYFLVLVGMLAIAVGSKLPGTASAVMIESGKGLVSAALLAFQIKRTPDGNTTTTQVTTPEPTIPPTPYVVQPTAPSAPPAKEPVK